MDGRPVICISSDSDFFSTGGAGPRRMVLSHFYPDAIASAGGVPVITGEQCPEDFVDFCDGLVLSGGEDIPAGNVWRGGI